MNIKSQKNNVKDLSKEQPHKPSFSQKMQFKKALKGGLKWLDINPNEIIDVESLILVYETDKNGNFSRYYFAKIDNDNHYTILSSGKRVPAISLKDKNLKRNDNICFEYRDNQINNSHNIQQSMNLCDLFAPYNDNEGIFVAKFKRTKTFNENRFDNYYKKQLLKNKTSGLEFFKETEKIDFLNKFYREKLIINDNKHIINKILNNKYIQIKDLLHLEDAIAKVVKDNKNREIEYNL